MAKIRRRRSPDGELPKKELPSLYCHAGRHWVETLEQDPFFLAAEDIAAGKQPSIWTCPLHRGEVDELPPPTEVAVKQEARRASRAMTQQVKEGKRVDQKGPRRAVVALLARPGGKESSKSTAYGRLACGHEMAVPRPKSPDSLGWFRCRRCLKEGRS